MTLWFLVLLLLGLSGATPLSGKTASMEDRKANCPKLIFALPLSVLSFLVHPTSSSLIIVLIHIFLKFLNMYKLTEK